MYPHRQSNTRWWLHAKQRRYLLVVAHGKRHIGKAGSRAPVERRSGSFLGMGAEHTEHAADTGK
jgi:hypothetical protein